MIVAARDACSSSRSPRSRSSPCPGRPSSTSSRAASTRGAARVSASVLGIHVGTLVHLTAATVGLSAILVSSASAFTVVKLLGALYLIVIGIRTLLGGADPDDTDPQRPPRRRRRDFARRHRRQRPQPEDGALLPRLPAAVRRPGRLPGLGADPRARAHVHGCSAWSPTRSGRWRPERQARRCASSRRWARTQRYVSGSVFLGLGVVTALTGSHRKA